MVDVVRVADLRRLVVVMFVVIVTGLCCLLVEVVVVADLLRLVVVVIVVVVADLCRLLVVVLVVVFRSLWRQAQLPRRVNLDDFGMLLTIIESLRGRGRIRRLSHVCRTFLKQA